jgi:transcriptional regulator with XRE-family HTH domain
VRSGNRRGAGEVGDRPRDPKGAVQPADREIQPRNGELQQPVRGCVQRRPPLEVRRREVRVSEAGHVPPALRGRGPGADDALAHPRRGLSGGAALEVRPGDRRHRNVQVDAVEQGPRDPSGISDLRALLAHARAQRVAREPARARQRGLFATVKLRAAKPLSPAYPKELERLGDHLRKRRLDLGLLQREAAGELGVTESTVYHWETGKTAPKTRHLPSILRFLGHDPRPMPETFAGRLQAVRTARGLSQAAFARLLGVDPGTVARWETGLSRPRRVIEAHLSEVLGQESLGS